MGIPKIQCLSYSSSYVVVIQPKALNILEDSIHGKSRQKIICLQVVLSFLDAGFILANCSLLLRIFSKVCLPDREHALFYDSHCVLCTGLLEKARSKLSSKAWVIEGGVFMYSKGSSRGSHRRPLSHEKKASCGKHTC